MLAALALLAVLAVDDPPKKVATANTGREAKAGDDAEIYDQGTPASATRWDLDAFVKLKRANDTLGMQQAGAPPRQRTVLLPAGTKLLVIETHLIAQDMTPVSSESYARELQAAALSSGQPRPVESAEVRILEGPFKGQARFVPVNSVALMRYPPPPPPAPRAKPAPRVASSADRAAALLKAGQNLERAGNRKAALEDYRRIVADFADTPSATAAASRVKSLAPSK